MAVSLKCSVRTDGIRKYGFCRKSNRKDGLLFQVYHTPTSDLNQSRQPIRFLHCDFNPSEDILAVADAKGNIFMIDLVHNKFWSLPANDKCTAITFSSQNKCELIVATSKCTVQIINFENGQESGNLKGHTLPPSQLSCGGDGGKMLLSAAACSSQGYQRLKMAPVTIRRGFSGEAIIWDMSSFTQVHCLNIRPDTGIKQAMFMSGVSSDYVLACFEDDTMCVWKFGAFECVKMISSGTLKESHHVKSIACTRNGRAMVVGGTSHSLVAFSLDTWTVMKVIELPDEVCGVKQLQFLPQPFDGGSNNVLAILSSAHHVIFLDLNSFTFTGHKISPERNGINKVVCSSSGCYVSCILQSGEVNIYCGKQILDSPNMDETSVKLKMLPNERIQNVKSVGRKSGNEKHPPLTERGKMYYNDDFKGKRLPLTKKRFSKVSEEIRSELDPKRLRPLLRQYGAFPSRYRVVAWRTALLQLPLNRKAFAGLAARGIHPSYAHVEDMYPLENHSELKNLKRLLSCLAHWSPLFSQVNYLPLFTYPFVKLFVHDPLGCFEAVATIILNYCQHWFEFFPFPPINVLAAIENILVHHDPDLLYFFMKKNVDTRLYAWPLLQVAFSEVLSNEEWLRLWDHVLVNEPSFLLAAVPAYCIVCRTALLSCKSVDDFQFFFRNQNPVDMDKFILKTYWVCQNTPAKFHPRQYLHDLQPLPAGDTYPVFNQYPKILVDENAEKLRKIQSDEEALILKEIEALKLLKQREEQKVVTKNEHLKQKCLIGLQKAYQHALQIEEDKVSQRHVELMNMKRDLLLTRDSGEGLHSQEEDQAKGNSSQFMDGKFSANLEQKRNRDTEDIPVAPRSCDFDIIYELEKKLEALRQQLQRIGLVEGCETPHGNPSQHDKEERDSIILDSEEESENAEEYKGWFGMGRMNKNGLQLPTKVKKTLTEADVPAVRPSTSQRSDVSDKIGFSKVNKKKRWEMDASIPEDQIGLTASRYKDVHIKENEAVKQAIEARLKVIFACHSP